MKIKAKYIRSLREADKQTKKSDSRWARYFVPFCEYDTLVQPS